MSFCFLTQGIPVFFSFTAACTKSIRRKENINMKYRCFWKLFYIGLSFEKLLTILNIFLLSTYLIFDKSQFFFHLYIWWGYLFFSFIGFPPSSFYLLYRKGVYESTASSRLRFCKMLKVYFGNLCLLYEENFFILHILKEPIPSITRTGFPNSFSTALILRGEVRCSDLSVFYKLS